MKKNITKNINFGKDFITTTLGISSFLLSLLIYALPLFIDLKQEPNVYITVGIGVLGLLLILAPDKILTMFIQPLVRLFTKEKDNE